VLAHAITRDKLEGHVKVDRTLTEGDTLFDGAVRVLHTPGHAPGHLCLWHEANKWLIAGDMVASVGTIVIDPDDDGDMAAYVRELARLAALPITRMFPAHGDPIDEPSMRLAFYLGHRAEREAKVLGSLSRSAPGVDLPHVVSVAYADTPAFLWPLASKSARAHLAKLVAEGKARVAGSHWARAD
jgi:glyoxylase-like metal-dependent hydrolase (beta-lactamase superfamily II)